MTFIAGYTGGGVGLARALACAFVDAPDAPDAPAVAEAGVAAVVGVSADGGVAAVLGPAAVVDGSGDPAGDVAGTDEAATADAELGEVGAAAETAGACVGKAAEAPVVELPGPEVVVSGWGEPPIFDEVADDVVDGTFCAWTGCSHTASVAARGSNVVANRESKRPRRNTPQVRDRSCSLGGRAGVDVGVAGVRLQWMERTISGLPRATSVAQRGFQ